MVLEGTTAVFLMPRAVWTRGLISMLDWRPELFEALTRLVPIDR